MLSSWFGGSGDNIPELIKKRKFGKAIQIVEEQLKKDPKKERLRQQLADLLHMDGQSDRAIEVLKGVADQYASQGFTVKAIAILKKIQRIDPEDHETDQKLSTMIMERDSQLVGTTTAYSSKPQAAPTGEVSDVAEELDIGLELVEEEMSSSAEEAIEADSDEIEIDVDEPAMHEPAGIEATPLFQSISREELLALIQGFEMRSFEPGDIIVAAGEPGDSLFIVASGVVKAFVADAVGHYSMVREMGEGDFFGEISLLTGKPRTATITAAEWCELLELDAKALAEISRTYPKVRQILEDVSKQRLGSQAEKAIRESDTREDD